MAELGTAYILIEPSMKGSQATITNELSGAGAKAGAASSSSFGKAFGSGLKTVAKVGAATFAAVGTATVGATVALVNGANQVASYGDNIDKMSQKLGLSYESFQKWDYILGQSGVDINSMQTGLKTMTNQLDNAKNGSADAQAMFSKLGISMHDMETMSREDIFEATIKGFQSMEDSTERAALANDIFGRSGQELIPLFNTSAEETAALGQAAKDLGMIMSDESVTASAAYNDSLDTLQRTAGGLKNSLVGEMLPGMTAVMDGLTGLATGSEGASAQITTGVQMAVGSFNQMLPMLLQVVSGIAMGLLQAAPTILSSLATGILTAIPTLLPTIMQVISSLVTTFIELLPMIIEVGMQVLAQLAIGIAQALPTLIPTAIETILNLVGYLIENVDLLIDAAIQLIIGLATGIVQAIPILIEKVPELIGKLVSAIIENAPKLLQAGKDLISKVKEGVVNAWSTLKSTISQKFETVKELISKPFEKAKEAVTKVIEKIKGLFSFKWSLPDLKLPHFSIGAGPTVLGIQLPKINIDWYGKATDNPYLFRSATVVGSSGGLRGFGEKGAEIVYGRDNLLRDIASVTSARPIDMDVNITVNGSEGQNVKELADIIMERMQNEVRRREAIFA